MILGGNTGGVEIALSAESFSKGAGKFNERAEMGNERPSETASPFR